MKKQPGPELIHTTPTKWLCRIVKTSRYNKHAQKNDDTLTAELIYGKEETIRGKNGLTLTTIAGTVYHAITGPTAEKSIRAMADAYNATGKLPPEVNKTKARVDGWKQNAKSDIDEELLK